jgi:hypothetical protein
MHAWTNSMHTHTHYTTPHHMSPKQFTQPYTHQCTILDMWHFSKHHQTIQHHRLNTVHSTEVQIREQHSWLKDISNPCRVHTTFSNIIHVTSQISIAHNTTAQRKHGIFQHSSSQKSKVHLTTLHNITSHIITIQYNTLTSQYFILHVTPQQSSPYSTHVAEATWCIITHLCAVHQIRKVLPSA